MKYTGVLVTAIVFMTTISLYAFFPVCSHKKAYFCSSESQEKEKVDAQERHNQSGEIVFVSVIV